MIRTVTEAAGGHAVSWQGSSQLRAAVISSCQLDATQPFVINKSQQSNFKFNILFSVFYSFIYYKINRLYISFTAQNMSKMFYFIRRR
jgi:hypothetical protein